MYIEDKEEFRRQMLHFAENWLDENKVSNPLDAAFARNYASPSSPGFYISIKEHNLDEYLTDEACEFFTITLTTQTLRNFTGMKCWF